MSKRKCLHCDGKGYLRTLATDGPCNSDRIYRKDQCPDCKIDIRVGDNVLLTSIPDHFTRHDKPHLAKMTKRPHKVSRILYTNGCLTCAELQSYTANFRGARVYHSFWIATTHLKRVK